MSELLMDLLVARARARAGLEMVSIEGGRRRWYRLRLHRRRRGGGEVVREWGHIPEPLPLLALMGEPAPERPTRPRRQDDACGDDRALQRTLAGHLRRRLAHGYVPRPPRAPAKRARAR